MLRGGDVNGTTQLRRQGLSITQIGAMTGFDRNVWACHYCAAIASDLIRDKNIIVVMSRSGTCGP